MWRNVQSGKNTGKIIISQAIFQLKPQDIKNGLSLSLSLSIYIYIYKFISVLYTESGRVFTALGYVNSVYHVFGICGSYLRVILYI